MGAQKVLVLSAFGASGFELEARESFFQLNAGLQEGTLFLGKPLNLSLMLTRAQASVLGVNGASRSAAMSTGLVAILC